ncbi:MAG: sigma-70 family RNA polymerase sigma factor [Polyangiaceae bacterium]
MMKRDRRPSSASRSGAGPSDAALVVAARARESWACEALFRRYAPLVHGLAFRLLGRGADVEDLVQDCFVQALESLERLGDPQAFAAWLQAVIVRTASKTIRRQRMLRRLGLLHPEPIDLGRIVSRDAPPDVAAELRAMYALIDDLPTRIRVPLVLRRVEGYSLDEVATMVGASLATVKRRVAEGERHLEAATGPAVRAMVGGKS